MDYYNRRHGIILEDLDDENVFIDKNGVLYFVDPIIFLETPDLGLGSPLAIPDPSRRDGPPATQPQLN